MSFDPVYLALRQEGYIIRSCLCTGLTEIKNANIDQIGRYYTAFFQLSNGFERFCKIIIILDYIISNNYSLPEKSYIKKFGHDIYSLYNTSLEIGTRKRYLTYKVIIPDLSQQILEFLSNFACKSRYANIDSLSTNHSILNPLKEWEKITDDIKNRHISRSRQMKYSNYSNKLNKTIKNIVFIRDFGFEDDFITPEEVIYQINLNPLVSKYVIKYLFLPLIPLRDIISSICSISLSPAKTPMHVSFTFPYLTDFFDFLWAENNIIMRKKKWP